MQGAIEIGSKFKFQVSQSSVLVCVVTTFIMGTSIIYLGI